AGKSSGAKVTPCAARRRYSSSVSPHRRRLAGMLWQGLVDPGPLRRLRRPDGCAGRCQLGVVERSVANNNEVRTRLRGAEQLRAALRAETPMHDVAAVG